MASMYTCAKSAPGSPLHPSLKYRFFTVLLAAVAKFFPDKLTDGRTGNVFGLDNHIDSDMNIVSCDSGKQMGLSCWAVND